jgi:CopG antitoxin of type II toxin-antitoxin system
MSKKKKVEPIPKEFSSREEAAGFWDKHDTADYPSAFRTIKVVSEFRNRHYEIPIDGDVAIRLQQRARKAGMPLGRLASELLRKELRGAE